MSRLVVALGLGQLLGLLGWIDPLFIPLALAGPVVVGAIAATRGLSLAWVAVLWASAGLCMLWTDWVVNREDVLFHAVVAVLMAGLGAVGWGLMRLLGRGRRAGQLTGS